MSFSEDDILPPGVYERLVDRLLEKRLERLKVAGLKPQKTAVDPAPSVFAGPVFYRSHQGSRPMSVVWELEYPLPAHLFRESARLAVRI